MVSRISRMTLVAVAVGAAVFLFLGTFLQRTTTDFFASPDETAVAFFARALNGKSFRVPYELPGSLAEIAGLRARSMVQDGAALVPVGFLGMPVLVAFLENIGRGLGAWLTPLLVLSAAYPLYRISARRSRRVGVLTAILFLSFPTVLLYANRALFPNLPVVALALWSVWLILKIGSRPARPFAIFHFLFSIFAGLAIGAAFLIRPVEAVWMLPWLGWAFIGAWGAGRGAQGSNIEPMQQGGVSAMRRSHAIMIAIVTASAALVCFGGWIVARQTYGSGHGFFPVGYFVRDTPASVVAEAASLDAGTGSALRGGLPFGFHPRTLWLNVKTYFGSVFGLWVGLALFGIALDLRRRGGFRPGDLPLYGLAAWTAGVLLLLYGQAAYADNINGGATIGNSFLRYMLPLVPLLVFACALAVDRCFNLLRGRGVVCGPAAVCLLVLLGIVTAFARDEEGVLRTRYELMRYAAIRAAAEAQLPVGAVIFSERSDKIFVAGPFIAVTPIPDAETLTRVRAAAVPSYLFTRTLGDDFADPVIAAYGGGRPLFTLQNETMYELGAQGAETEYEQ